MLAACGRRDVRFDVDNARAHVNMLAGTIGSRPVGSDANVKARNYLIDQLRLYGFDVRVQETDAVRPELGTTARVANIIAFKAGARREAIGLVAHYDSVPEGPGAGDDGLGTAVSLEAARVLASKPARNYSLLVLLTDGEEAGLMGAAAAVTDPEIKERLQAYLNIEAIGAAAPTVLFESGPDAYPLLKAWARGAPRPRGASYAIEIYKRLPNDTDFTILKGAGIPGLNFAAIGDSYAYHTSRDTAERLTNDVIRETGENVVGTLDTLDATDLPPRGDAAANVAATGGPGAAGSSAAGAAPPAASGAAASAAAGADSPRYFDIGQQSAIVLGGTTSRVLTVLAVLIAVFAWLRVLRAMFAIGVLRVIVSFIWMALAVAGSALAVAGAAWLLRHGRAVFNPWYAHPDRFGLLLVTSGLTAWWYITRLMFLLPERGRSLRAPAAVWVVTLPIWAALAAYIEYVAPAAALLWSVPLLAAGILLALVPARAATMVRFASLLIAAVVGVLWLRDSHDLFVFLVSVFSRLPLVAPFWVYPAFIVACAIMLAPPFLAVVTGLLRGRLAQAIASGVLLVVLATSTGLAYFGEPYTTARPQRRAARYLADGPSGHAWWEIGGNEPGLDLNVTPSEGPRWRPQPEHTPPPTTIPMAAFRQPFVFRADADRLDPPADISMSAVTQGDTTELDVTVVPKMESLGATFVLPAGIEPAQANLAGRQIAGGQWRARFIAMPATGVAFRATVPAALASRLADTAIILSASRLPGADQPRWPMWLPRDRTDWTLSAQWIVRPSLSIRIATPPPPVPGSSTPPPPLPGAPLPPPTLPPATVPPGK
jgi:hypothetical protein